MAGCVQVVATVQEVVRYLGRPVAVLGHVRSKTPALHSGVCSADVEEDSKITSLMGRFKSRCHFTTAKQDEQHNYKHSMALCQLCPCDQWQP